MYVNARLAGVGAATITYTLLVNGVASALSVAMANTAVAGSDLVNAIPIVAGDRISLQVAKSANVTSSQTDIMVSMQMAA
jgi:hypothetical protein